MLSGSYSSPAVSSYGASSLGLSTFFNNVARAEQTLNTGLTGGADTLFSMEGSRSMLSSGPAANLMGFGRFGSSAAYTGGMGAGMGGSGIGMGAGVMVGGPPPGVVGAGVYQGPLVFGNPTPQPGQVFGPNVFAAWQGGGAAPAGGGTNVTASSGASKSNGISEKTREGAIDDLVKNKGYEVADAKRIVEMSEQAANGDRRTFEDIVHKVPSHKFEEKKNEKNEVQGPTIEQQKAAWVRDFGNWQARYIEDVDRTKDTSEARQQLVADAGSQGGARYEFKRKPDATSKGYGYEVVKAEGKDTAVNPGARVYFNPQNKQWYKDAAMTQPLSLPGAADASGKPESVTVGGGSSYLTLVPDGSVVAPKTRANDDPTHQIHDRYRVEGEPVGATAAADYAKIPKTDEKRYVYFDRASNTWFYRDTENKPKTFTQPPTYRSGRLSFGKSDSVNPAMADTVGDYMTAMHTAAEADRTRRGTVEPQEKAQRQERVKRVQEELGNVIGERKGDLTYAYDADKNVLTITCPTEKAGAVAEAMKGDDAKTAGRGDTVLRDLPEGTRISVNGRPSFPAGAGAYKRIRDEVKQPPAESKPADQSAAAQQPASTLTGAQKQVFADLDTKAQALDAAARSYETANQGNNPGLKTSTRQNYERARAAYKDAVTKAETNGTQASADRSAYDAAFAPHKAYSTAMASFSGNGTRPTPPAAQTATETRVDNSVQQPVMPASTGAASTGTAGAQTPQSAIGELNVKAAQVRSAAMTYHLKRNVAPNTAAGRAQVDAEKVRFEQALADYQKAIEDAQRLASQLPERSQERARFMHAWGEHRAYNVKMQSLKSPNTTVQDIGKIPPFPQSTIA